MRNRFLIPMCAVLAALLCVSLAATPALGQTSTIVSKAKAAAVTKTGAVPLTRDGHADLEGIWNTSTLTPLERPAQLAGKQYFTEQEAAQYEKQVLDNQNRDRRDKGAEADVAAAYNDSWYDSGTKVVKSRRTSLIIDPPDGKIPAFTPEAQKREEARMAERRKKGPDPADSWEDRSLGERCLTRGAPKLPSAYNNNFQIVQTPQYIAIMQEMIHETRVIPLDNRPHVDKNIRQYMGDSVGHWEGNTLVVDTTNYNDKIVSNPINCCRGAGANLHVIERFTRVDADTIDYQYTVDDPTTYTRQWTVAVPMIKAEGPIYEYACHEGNYGMRNLLSAARAREKAAAEAAKQK